MKNLNFSITFNNHTFKILANHKNKVCSYNIYNIEDKYTATLSFSEDSKNTYAQVKYKNIVFSGTATKRNNWHIKLDLHCIIQKHYNMFYFEKIKQNDNIFTSFDTQIKDHSDTTDYPKNILCLYDQLINELSEQYLLIQDKKEFKQQMCEYLFDSYPEIKTLDETLEYENWDDINDDEEPIIETVAVKNTIIKECKKLFFSFYQSEADTKNKESIITLENITKEMPILNKIPQSYLCKEFDRYMDENYKDLINPYIHYNLTDVLHHIGVELYKEYQYYIFINTMEEKIDMILSSINVSVISKEEIYSHFKMQYSKEKLPSDKDFKQAIINFVNNYVEFYNLYNKFFSLFKSDNIKLEWNEKTIQLFQKYDKKQLPVDSQHLAEYEAYQYIMPHYRKHLFRKNRNEHKPSIEQFPAFISYASSVLDILFKHNILVDNEDKVIYNEDVDINFAREEIEEISIQ